MPAAEGMEAQPGLSSLIGADLSHFKPASERVVHVAAEPQPSEESDDEGSTAEPLDSDEPARWARPDR
jgi:hypothetical protein